MYFFFLIQCPIFYSRNRQVEENTDAILDNKSKSKRNAKSQEEVDETVTKRELSFFFILNCLWI